MRSYAQSLRSLNTVIMNIESAKELPLKNIYAKKSPLTVQTREYTTLGAAAEVFHRIAAHASGLHHIEKGTSELNIFIMSIETWTA